MDEEKIQKYIKQVRDEANEDMKTHLGALNELHSENLKGIREGNIIITKQVEEINQKLGEHTVILSSHTEMIGEIKEDIVIIKEDIVIMKEDIVIMKGDIKTIKEDLNKKVDHQEFSLLKQKVV